MSKIFGGLAPLACFRHARAAVVLQSFLHGIVSQLHQCYIHFKRMHFIETGNATGTIVLDSSCDRTPDYYFFKMGSDGPFDVIGTTSRKSDDGTIKMVRNWNVCNMINTGCKMTLTCFFIDQVNNCRNL
jgi:hypothetical protein